MILLVLSTLTKSPHPFIGGAIFLLTQHCCDLGPTRDKYDFTSNDKGGSSSTLYMHINDIYYFVVFV